MVLDFGRQEVQVQARKVSVSRNNVRVRVLGLPYCLQFIISKVIIAGTLIHSSKDHWLVGIYVKGFVAVFTYPVVRWASKCRVVINLRTANKLFGQKLTLHRDDAFTTCTSPTNDIEHHENRTHARFHRVTRDIHTHTRNRESSPAQNTLTLS